MDATGFLYDINTQAFTEVDDPQAANGTYLFGISGSTLYGIYVDASSVEHGFVDNNGIFTTVDFPSSTGTDVFRGSGAALVGTYDLNSSSHGFLFDGTNYVTLDYPATGAHNTEPSGIYGNTIVGVYYDRNNFSHGFEAIYTPASDTPVMPTWALVVLAGLLLLIARRYMPLHL